MTPNLVYEITCNTDNCGDKYEGETYRPLHERFTEHFHNANNPTAKSYVNTPMAKHYRDKHTNSSDPSLSVKILEKANSTVNRKIREARLIAKNNPTINDRQELSELQQFLI